MPTTIDEVVREYSKAVIRANPENLVEWSRDWFATKAEENKQQ